MKHLIVFLTFMSFSSLSVAGFEYTESKKKPEKIEPKIEEASTVPLDRIDKFNPDIPKGYKLVNNKRQLPLHSIGSGVADQVHGRGKSSPLDASLEMIIPDMWVTIASQDVDDKQLVDWEGGMEWPQILRLIALRQKLQFIVDWTTKSIYFRSRSDDDILVEYGNLFNPRVMSRGFIGNQGRNISIARESSIGSLRSWRLERGDRLKPSIEAWGKVAGWAVNWTFPVDVTISASAEFEGTFSEAVRQVVREMRETKGYNVVARDYKDPRGKDSTIHIEYAE